MVDNKLSVAGYNELVEALRETEKGVAKPVFGFFINHLPSEVYI
jgi:hypothetical protein